jgi:uncharacterized protein YozE (UPF0346 family)
VKGYKHMTKSFTTWLRTKKEEDTRIGDLARDVVQDPSWPSRATTKATFKRHLEEKDACIGAFGALDEAWNCYKSRG